MKLKLGASIDLLLPPLKLMLPRIADVYRMEMPYNLVITSGADGEYRHSIKSAHYRGQAIDIRTWTTADSGVQISMEKRLKLKTRIADILGPAYDVIAEPTHLHIELDPRTFA
jgi:hypothetical protein